ncbi:hypothetical protein ACWFRJ_32235 [Streptomyces sp. NPDC055239]
MKDRSLEALGLDDVPAKLPLTYPGRPATEPALLSGDELLPLDVRQLRLGDWPVAQGRRLDETLRELGQVGAGLRHPVIAVGSNASPGQVSHKLTRLGIPATVPMVPVEVRGVGIGCSGHISPAGYVAATPYIDRSARATLVVTWLDATQLKAVDDTEFPDYRRAILPGDEFDMVMPSGERLGGAYIYFSAHGVLAGSDGRPRPGGGDQSELLAALLFESEDLRQLLGPDPTTWVAKAGADREVRERGTAIFGATGRVLPQNEFLPYLDDSGDLRFYDDLPPLAGSLPSMA